jgi:hypothetical protein
MLLALEQIIVPPGHQLLLKMLAGSSFKIFWKIWEKVAVQGFLIARERWKL